MSFRIDLASQRYTFQDLKALMAKATPLRSGDCLAGVAASTMIERIQDLILTHQTGNFLLRGS